MLAHISLMSLQTISLNSHIEMVVILFQNLLWTTHARLHQLLSMFILLQHHSQLELFQRVDSSQQHLLKLSRFCGRQINNQIRIDSWIPCSSSKHYHSAQNQILMKWANNSKRFSTPTTSTFFSVLIIFHAMLLNSSLMQDKCNRCNKDNSRWSNNSNKIQLKDNNSSKIQLVASRWPRRDGKQWLQNSKMLTDSKWLSNNNSNNNKIQLVVSRWHKRFGQEWLQNSKMHIDSKWLSNNNSSNNDTQKIKCEHQYSNYNESIHLMLSISN